MVISLSELHQNLVPKRNIQSAIPANKRTSVNANIMKVLNTLDLNSVEDASEDYNESDA